MTAATPWTLLLLVFAIGCAACDGGSPSAPSALTLPLPVAPRAPVVTAISPSAGSTVRPTPVSISGTGFVVGATVSVGVPALNVRVVDSTTITAIAPAGVAGPVDVVVTNPGGLAGALAAAFNYSVDGPFTVTPSADVVDAGGELRVSWTAPGARPGDWIAVFRVGANYEDEWYGLTNGATSGTHTLTAPARPGVYEFRYLVGDGFNDVARSSPVTVR